MNTIPRILFADSDALVAAFLKNTLTNAGYEVIVINEGPAAMAAIQTGTFDAAIVSADLPGLSGYEILSGIRQEHVQRNLPVMVLSARAQEQVVLRAFELGANDTMSKPISPLELTARVRRLIQAR